MKNSRFSMLDKLNQVLKEPVDLEKLILVDGSEVTAMVYNEEDSKDGGDVTKAIPNIAPPFTECFISLDIFNTPNAKMDQLFATVKQPDKMHIKQSCGAYIKYFEVPEGIRPNISMPGAGSIAGSHNMGANAKWILMITGLFSQKSTDGMLDTGVIEVTTILYVNADGTACTGAAPNGELGFGLLMSEPMLLERGKTSDVFLDLFNSGEGRDVWSYSVLLPALSCITFMHCKNVQLTERDPNLDLPSWAKKHREKKGEPPLLKYYTINISIVRKLLKNEGNIEHNGFRKALHICRGHFKNYVDGKGLFGKYHGLYWVDMHVRGDQEIGVIKKDYKLKPEAKGNG
ncbi:MAG: hypothetical protein WCQ41_04050 [Bacillota bacterium]